jgi:hypothetical protein
MLCIDRVSEKASNHPAIYTIFLVLMAEKEMFFFSIKSEELQTAFEQNEAGHQRRQGSNSWMCKQTR